MIINAAFGGYVVILLGILTGIFTGQPINKRIVSCVCTPVMCKMWSGNMRDNENMACHYPNGMGKGGGGVITDPRRFSKVKLSP
jgi:hypothetical protein